MLELSENAAAALETIRMNEGIPEEHGTRLSPEQQPSGDLAVRLEFVEDVPDGDKVAKQGDTKVHVAPEIVEPLADTVMDLRDTEQGLTFVFRPQTVQ